MKEKKKKISIIGVGLLGGSLALALKGRGGFRLVGWNHRASSRRKAAKILPVAPTIQEAVEGAEVVVLCAHSGAIAPVLRQLAPFIGKDTLLMDVSSVKGAVVRGAALVPGMAEHFVPCHPMAGKEKSGPANADKDLYRGRFVFITPLTKNPPGLVRRAARFWKDAGAIPVILRSGEHDRFVALTSHLPHLLACALMSLYGANRGSDARIHRAVGSGFRDFTRIAGGSPAMWSDIMKMNAPDIVRFLSAYRHLLAGLEKKLIKTQGAGWTSFFEKARSLREKL